MKLLSAPSSYLAGVISELRKVVWPSLPTLGRYFLSVVVGLALATALVGAVDYVFIQGLTHIIK